MDFPSIENLYNSFTSKFREKQPTVDPTIKASWTQAFGRSVANTVYSCVILIKEVLKQFNPMTATGTYLELWASYDLLSRLSESSSIGVLRVYGVNGESIPANTEFTGSENAIIYTNSVYTEIQPQDTDTPSVAIYVITRSGTTATASSLYNHGLSTGMWVNVAGLDQLDYNVIAVITVINDQQFTYEVSGSPVTPSTGIGSASLLTKISSITSNGGIATVETQYSHQLVDQQYVKIQGVDVSDYNGIHQITYVSKTGFSYAVPDPTSDSVGFGSLNSIHANVNLTSSDTGTSTTLEAGSYMTYNGSNADVFENCVTIEGMQGGASNESDDSLRSRLLVSRSAQEGIFTNDQIELSAKLINGNTRVYIQNPDNDSLSEPDAVLAGQIRVFIIRDDDPIGVIPIGSILQTTKKSIVENGRLPASMWDTDVFVLPPSQVRIDVVMTNVLPNTASMRNALKSQFEAYFIDNALFGQNIDNDLLRAVARQTQDISAGDVDQAFIKQFDWTNAQISTDILGVSSSAGIARFTYNSGLTIVVGDQITISGFITNTAYNGTYTIDTVGTGFFEISTISYGSEETGGLFLFETEGIAKDELPILGNITVNGNLV